VKNLHTRIIVLTYLEDEIPLHDTKEEQEKWYAALGRMVAYELYDEQNKAEHSTMQYVEVAFKKKYNTQQIRACYNGTVSMLTDEGAVHIALAEKALSTLYNSFTPQGQQFVMGAVLHSNGVWDFHS